ncbi:hypothetical protein D3C72_2194060 [compost metagenome]
MPAICSSPTRASGQRSPGGGRRGKRSTRDSKASTAAAPAKRRKQKVSGPMSDRASFIRGQLAPQNSTIPASCA